MKSRRRRSLRPPPDEPGSAAPDGTPKDPAGPVEVAGVRARLVEALTRTSPGFSGDTRANGRGGTPETQPGENEDRQDGRRNRERAPRLKTSGEYFRQCCRVSSGAPPLRRQRRPAGRGPLGSLPDDRSTLRPVDSGCKRVPADRAPPDPKRRTASTPGREATRFKGPFRPEASPTRRGRRPRRDDFEPDPPSTSCRRSGGSLRNRAARRGSRPPHPS